jgi:hypothetical protein
MSFLETVKELTKSYQSCEFVLLNRGVMRELGVNPTIVLSELLSRFNYHASKKELDKDGSFYCTTEKLEELTTLKYKAQATAIKILEEKGLIKATNKRGNIRYFQILIDNVKSLIERFSKKVTKAKTDNPKENSRNAQKRKLVLPKGKFPIYKKAVIKTQDKNHNKILKPNKSSSLKQIKSESSNVEDVMIKRNMCILDNFLQEKGFSKHMIKETAKQFVTKGITKFKLIDLAVAYRNMLEHNEKVKKVIYPPTFFANGVALLLPKIEGVQDSEDVYYPPVPFYNWMES